MTQPDQTFTGGNGSFRNGLLYLLIGGGIGATLALLFAPKSGADLRHDISDITRKGYDGSLELAQNIKNHSTEILHNLADKKDHILDLAASKFARAPEQAAENVASAVERAGNPFGEHESKDAPKNTGAGRRPSSIV